MKIWISKDGSRIHLHTHKLYRRYLWDSDAEVKDKTDSDEIDIHVYSANTIM